MAIPVPHGFVDLSTAYAKTGEQQYNAIGIVVDNLPTAMSRGSDWMCKMTLSDPLWFGGLGATFKFFNKKAKNIPVVKKNGDILIIRNFKVKNFHGIMGISNYSTTWILLDGSSVTNSSHEEGKDIEFEKMGEQTANPTVAELQYAKKILEAQDPNTVQPPAKPTSLQLATIMSSADEIAPKPKDKFCLFTDLRPGDRSKMVFVDLVCEVRRTYKTDTRMEMSVTDYTPHDLLYNYLPNSQSQGADGDPYGYVQERQQDWPGPFGKMTMQVALWDAHSVWAHSNVEEGNYLLIKNVKIAMDSNGSLMQGNCHGDKHDLSKVNVTILKPKEAHSKEKLKDLLRRKQAYERKAKEEGLKVARDPAALKRKHEIADVPAEDSEETAKKARNKKKRELKKRKRNGNLNEPVQIAEDTTTEPVEKPTFLPPTSAEVICANFPVPRTPLHRILDREILKRKHPDGRDWYWPFQNAKYKSHVRVVDFFPHDLKKFAMPYRESEFDDLSENENDMMESDPDADDPEAKWEWRFVLFVEDAGPPLPDGQQKERMQLIVAEGDGDYLLKMDACDLRKKPEQLAALERKLWGIWGDLHELKEEARKNEIWKGGVDEVMDYKAKNKPFEVLIKEYGVRCRDEEGKVMGVMDYWRMFRMFQTTIR